MPLKGVVEALDVSSLMKRAFLFAFLAVGGNMNGSVIWLEAERFQDIGGWTRDAQFLDQMGSPYLLATGMGEPVANAQTTITVEKEGRYRFGRILDVPDWSREIIPPLSKPGVNVIEGDYLLEVNGVEVTTERNIYSYFEDLAGKQFRLTGRCVDVDPRDEGTADGRVDTVGIVVRFGVRQRDPNIAVLDFFTSCELLDDLSGPLIDGNRISDTFTAAGAG